MLSNCIQIYFGNVDYLVYVCGMDVSTPKIGIIIPDRGDRPEFLAHCLWMMECQTLNAWMEIMIIDQPAENAEIDITKRYRMGYDAMRGKGYEVIFLIENDDWYAADYIEIMYNAWRAYGRPDILGHTYTLYYHLNLKRHFTFHHVERSSAMNTMLKPDLQFEWCKDNDPYTDIHLWHVLKGQTFTPPRHICLGMKHGIGKCGGYMHISHLHRFANEDGGLLSATADPKSLAFYNSFPQHEFNSKPDMATMYLR